MNAGKKLIWPLVAAIAIAGGSYLGTVEMNHGNVVRADSPAQTAKPTPTPRSETVAPVNDLSKAFRSVHNALKDAVVNIHVVQKSVATDGMGRNGLPEGFKLPEGFGLPPGFKITPENPVREGTGSGVIVSPDGYVLTNNHVVENATDIEVRLNDGRTLKAKVIGTDPKTDLAVVRINADHLTYAKFGDSDATEVGDWVLAFGSPLGFSQTMTQGIISAKGREIGIIASHNPALEGLAYENFLQTDAAINPGNSGGPLVNLQGEVIGINAAIASNTGEYNGIGFSIPSNDASYIMESLIKHGKVVRGFLDVAIEDMATPSKQDQGLVDSIKKEGFTGKGVLVAKVDPEGPAGKGGIQSGDVITAIDGKPVESMNGLRNKIARIHPDSKVKLSVFRDGKTKELTITLGTQPEQNLAFAREHGEENSSVVDNKDLGISVKSLDKDTAQKVHLEAGKGVVVTEVAPSSTAATLGINEGDVITHVGKTEVDSPEQFSQAMGKVNLSDGVRLSLRSEDGMDRTVFMMKK